MIMRHLLFLFIALIFSFTFIYVQSKESHHVPFLLWSSKPTSQISPDYLTKKYTVADVYALLSDMKSPIFMKDNGKGSKILCIFIVDNLQLENSALTQDLKALSLLHVLPYTIRKDESESLIDSFYQLSSSDVNLMVTNENEFTSIKNNLNKNRNEIILVSISDNKEKMDEIMHWIKDLMVDSEIYFALTGDRITPMRTVRMLLAETSNVTTYVQANYCPDGSYYINDTTNGNFCFSHYVYITPSIITGIVISFIFIVTAYIGLSALSDIQTPLRYPSIAPPLGKEY